MKFIFDNCVSSNLVDALRCLDKRHELVHHREKFTADTPDPVWIAALAAEKRWIIISGDPRISRGQAERAAWIESRLTAFFCGDAWGSRPVLAQASEMLRWWPDIITLSKTTALGSGYLLEFKTKQPVQIYPVSSRPARKK